MSKRSLKIIILMLMFTTLMGCLNNGKKDNLYYKIKPVDDAVIQRFYELLIKSDMDSIIQIFKEHKELDVNKKYFQGGKIDALAVALIKGDVHLAEFLIKKMKARETIFLVPFYIAEVFKTGNSDMVSYILRKAKVLHLSGEKKFAADQILYWALNENRLDIVRQAIEILDVKHPAWKEYIKGIFFEVRSLEIAKLLESYKIGLNDDGHIQIEAFIGLLNFDLGYGRRDRDVGFIACYFMDKCSKEYLKYLWEKIEYASYPEVLKRFIEIGVDINMLKGDYSSEKTELISAIINNKVEVVKLLLEAGADANILDQCKKNPLLYALEMDQVSEEMIDLLMPKTEIIDPIKLIKFLECSKDKLKIEKIPLKLELLFKKGFKITPFPKTGQSVFEACTTLTAYNAIMDGFMSQHPEISIEQKKGFRRKIFFKYEILDVIMKNMQVYLDSEKVDGSTEGLEKCLEDAGLSVNTILENGNSIFMNYCVKLKSRLKVTLKGTRRICCLELEEELIKFKIVLESMVNLRPNANIRNVENETCIGCLINCCQLFNKINPEYFEYFSISKLSYKSLIIEILINRYLELINEAGIMYQDQYMKQSCLRGGESALRLVGTYTDIEEEIKVKLEEALFEGPLPERIEYMNCREILDYALAKSRY